MNTIHSVSNTSRMRSSEAIAVRNSFSFRSFMMRVMLVMAIVLGGKVAWGESITITATNSGISTGSYQSGTFIQNDITFSYNNWLKSNTNIQAKASTTNSIYNTVAIPGRITSIVFKQTGDARAITVYGGTASQPTNRITSPATAATMTFDFSSYNYNYFSMKTPGNACYFSQIIIYFELIPHNVTWSINGNADPPINTSILTNSNVPADPSTPSGCTDKVFAGWTTSPITGEQNTKPNPLYSRDDLVGTYVSSDTTYYAVFGIVSSYDYRLYSGELKEGDYIVYYGGKAMKNTVSSNRLTYETVTPSGNVITTDHTSIVWHIAPSGSYWTIYNPAVNKYAASTGTKNQAGLLASGSDDKSLWTVSGTSTYEFVNKKNSASNVNANLRNNDTYGFACYGTGTGGALSLYKKNINYYAYSTSCTNYSVTANANDPTLGTVSVLGSIITATPNCSNYASPAYNVTSGSATVTQNGNEFTVTPSSNCNIQINFVSIPKYTVTFNAGSGICEDESQEEETRCGGIRLPSATVSEDCEYAYSFCGWSTSEVDETTVAPSTIVGTTNTIYHPSGNITLYAVYKRVLDDSYITYDFSNIPGFNSWSTSYSEHIVNYPDAIVTFENANRNTSTITDIPVTKGQPVSVVLNNMTRRIKEAQFVCKKWGTKTQTITLNYSTDGGESYTSTGTTSTNFSVSNSNLDANTNAVKITFSNSSNQIGIKSCAIKVTNAIYNTSPDCITSTVTYNANGATNGSVPVDNNIYDNINYTVTVLDNTGNLERTGHTFEGWNTEPDGSGDNYEEGDTFTIAENTALILYAHWVPIDYTVSWLANGLALESQDYPYGNYIPEGDIYDEDAEDYACEGKHFIGWSVTEFDETDDWPTIITREQIANTPVSGEMIYYAVYANVNANIAPFNTILWSETWYMGEDEAPSEYYNDVRDGTTVYNDDGTFSYAETDGESITKLHMERLAEGESPELLLSKGGGTWTISNIPTGGTYKMSLTFKSNKNTFNLTTTTANIDISGSEKSWIITADENVTKFDLTLANTGTNNARIDDVELRIIQIHGTGYTTFCPCNYDIENISNGDMVWAGKNGPTNNWNSKSNWAVYNSSDSKYHLAASVPTESSNVFIINKRTECNINVKPLLTSNVTCNNITLSNNMGINLDEYNLTVTGDLTNDGSEITGTGKVIFAGTAAQTISGATTFGNVEFNNSNGITASTEPTINGTATFTNGVINGNVTFGSGATVSGASASSYVNGKVTKNGMSGAFTFPTGTASLYAPFEASSSTASNVSVQYATGSEGMPDWWNHSGNLYNAGLHHASDRENWQISASATTTLSGIKLYWNAAADNYHSFEEDASDLNSYLNVAVVKKGGFYWQNLGKASIDGSFTGAGSITAAEPLSITIGAKAAGDGEYFATFASSNGGEVVLPIELTSFTANCNGRSSLIEWTTATEKNNDFFVLERSNDAINFKEIARVAGAGNSIEPINYAYTDYGARSGDNYYRLVQVDYDGTSTASEIIVTNCPAETLGEPDVLAFPNPFDDNLTLHFENFGNIQATVEVYDMLGRMVQTQKVNCSQNDYEVVLRLAGLSDGTYNVRISTTEFVINRQVIKN